MSTAKRSNTSVPDGRPDSRRQCISQADPIIGLDVCGKVYYCHQFTLVNASPYFATRFKGQFVASVSYVDSRGRNVYFLERPPAFFHYIFQCIVSGGTLNLPDFQTDPTLIRNLRVEADYFGMEHLGELLQIKSFSPEQDNRGVLYWLGTNKGTGDYQNPFTTGAVGVGGWMDNDDFQNVDGFAEARLLKSRARFVHYQEPVTIEYDKPMGNAAHGMYFAESIEGSCVNMGLFASCHSVTSHAEVILDLKTLRLRPSHYSMRAGVHLCPDTLKYCDGMEGRWIFEGSKDKVKWDRLHVGDGAKQQRVNIMNHEESKKPDKNALELRLEEFSEEREGHKEDKISDLVTCFLERSCRETWMLQPPPSSFYRYFRICRSFDDGRSCLHGEGIEVFGDVYEDYVEAERD